MPYLPLRECMRGDRVRQLPVSSLVASGQWRHLLLAVGSRRAQNLSVSTELTKEEILSKWEKRWHPLTSDKRKEFLRHHIVYDLTRLPADAVLKAMGKTHKMSDVLQFARVFATARAKPVPAKGSTAIGRGSNTAGAGSRPSGVASGAVGGYYSGMVRTPGTGEAAIGERCSACTAWVPSGVAHDCN